MSETSIWAKLAAPLDPASIKVLAQPGRPPMNYVDSRTVTDRLDAVVPGEWNVTLDILPMRVNPRDGEEYAIKARLDVLGVTREDVGQGNDYKSAASDALKRAAVRFGIGRELYGEKVEGTTHPAQAPVVPMSKVAKPASADIRAAVATQKAAPVAAAPAPAGDFPPACPKCGGKMWDNREGKKNPKAPDARCRDKACDGVVWPPKATAASRVGTPVTETDSAFVARMTEDAAPGGDWEPPF